jgi:hypothetical protein
MKDVQNLICLKNIHALHIFNRIKYLFKMLYDIQIST